MSGVPECPQQQHFTSVVPDTGGHQPPGPCHPNHLPHPGFGVAHEVDHELRQGDVERSLCERKRLGLGLDHLDAGQTRSAGFNERGRWVAAETFAAPSWSTSAAESAPGPQPTSRARVPGSAPANPISADASEGP